jgi:ribosomal protein S12 methylthiotransferase accessory factor YcaO
MSDTPEAIAARLSAAIASIPAGYEVTLQWTADEWPCVHAVLSRDFGRIWRDGHGNHPNASVAAEAAITEAVEAIRAVEAVRAVLEAQRDE